MDNIKSWVDAESLRHLAEELLEPSIEEKLPVKKPEEKSGFEGFTKVSDTEDNTSVPMSSVVSALADARKVAEKSGMLENKFSEKPSDELKSYPRSSEAVPSQQETLIFNPNQNFQSLVKKWLKEESFQAIVLFSGGKILLDTMQNGMFTKMAQKQLHSAKETGGNFIRVGAGLVLQMIRLPFPEEEVLIAVLLPFSFSREDAQSLAMRMAEDLR